MSNFFDIRSRKREAESNGDKAGAPDKKEELTRLKPWVEK
jgi:hypothetical protein